MAMYVVIGEGSTGETIYCYKLNCHAVAVQLYNERVTWDNFGTIHMQAYCEEHKQHHEMNE